MRQFLRSASRVGIAGVAVSSLGLLAFSSPAAAAPRAPAAVAGPAQPPPNPSGLTPGRDAEGKLYYVGSSTLIQRFCPNGEELGFVCLFTGDDETGTGVALQRGNSTPASECTDIPLPTAFENVDNDTNRPITVGDGTCAHRGAVTVSNEAPGVDENVPPSDLWIT